MSSVNSPPESHAIGIAPLDHITAAPTASGSMDGYSDVLGDISGNGHALDDETSEDSGDDFTLNQPSPVHSCVDMPDGPEDGASEGASTVMAPHSDGPQVGVGATTTTTTLGSAPRTVADNEADGRDRANSNPFAMQPDTLEHGSHTDRSGSPEAPPPPPRTNIPPNPNQQSSLSPMGSTSRGYGEQYEPVVPAATPPSRRDSISSNTDNASAWARPRTGSRASQLGNKPRSNSNASSTAGSRNLLAVENNPFAVVGSSSIGRRDSQRSTRSTASSSVGGPRMNALDTGLAQKLGLSSYDMLEYNQVWAEVVRRKLLDKYGQMSQKEFVKFIHPRASLPKKIVKSCAIFADRRQCKGTLDRNNFIVALKCVAMAQDGRDFCSEPQNASVGLPVLTGILEGGGGGGDAGRARSASRSSSVRTPSGASTSAARTPTSTASSALANASPSDPTAPPPVPTSRRPLPPPPDADMEPTPYEGITTTPSGGGVPVTPAPPPPPARTSEQIRSQHRELLSSTPTGGGGGSDSDSPSVHAGTRTPDVALMEAAQLEREGEEMNRIGPALQLKSDVDVVEEESVLNVDLFGIHKSLILKAPASRGYALASQRTFKDESPTGADVILVNEPKSLKKACTVTLGFSPRMAGLYFSPKSGDGDRDSVIAMLSCKFPSPTKWKAELYGKAPAVSGQVASKKMGGLFFWGDVVPLPAVADNAAVFCKIVRMDKKKPVCMEHLVLRPRTDGEVRGAVCPGWDVVPAVRPSAIASALPMGQILRASSKVWTGQPEECYRISCDTGDLALVATLSYIVCMGMASRLKK
eukprot:m.113287 g.113287  ORF g.113287 m.113287 type:complete len:811 (+) comp10797_c0_seq3:653-3085(+)